nr:restriction endonuclease subunit S [Acinetobacter terrae]
MGKIDFLNIDFVGEEEYERLRKRCEPKRGDILISCSGSIGRVSAVDTDRPFVMVRSAALLKLKKDIVTSKFMEYLLRTPYLQSQMIRSSKSSSQANLFQEPIKRLKIFLPSIELQENFEKFIAISTKEKEKLVQSNDKLEALFKSLQNQAFSGTL